MIYILYETFILIWKKSLVSKNQYIYIYIYIYLYIFIYIYIYLYIFVFIYIYIYIFYIYIYVYIYIYIYIFIKSTISQLKVRHIAPNLTYISWSILIILIIEFFNFNLLEKNTLILINKELYRDFSIQKILRRSNLVSRSL